MGTLSAGMRHGPDGECGRLRLHLDHHLLMAQKLDAGPAMLPPTPVPKDEAALLRPQADERSTLAWRDFLVSLPFH